jgi:hypothetical protein
VLIAEEIPPLESATASAAVDESVVTAELATLCRPTPLTFWATATKVYATPFSRPDRVPLISVNAFELILGYPAADPVTM